MGAVVTRVLTFGSGRKVLLAQLAAADNYRVALSNMAMIQGRLELFASKLGCDAVRIYGRPGWAKVLEGYGQPFVAFERDLPDGCRS